MSSSLLFLDRKEGLYLQDTETKGLGLFCIHPIAEGEELEVTPSILLNEKDNTHTEETILRDYVFGIGDVSKELLKNARIRKVDDASCVIMGIASYCNHDADPNAEVIWEDQDGALFHTLRATRDIPADTEICTTYGKTWFAERDMKEKSK